MAHNSIRKFTLIDFFIYLLLGIFAFLCLYPFWYMLIYSISDPAKVSAGAYLLPKGLNFYNLKEVIQLKGISSAFIISVLRTSIGTFCTIFACSFLGYLFTKQEMPGRTFLYRLLIITMYVGGGMIPTYLVIRAYGLTNNFFVYILPAMVSAYNIILIKTYIEQLPASLEESAMIDGAGYLRIYTSIILPLSMPIIATIGLFAAVGQWNSWFDNHLYTAGKESLTTLQYLLYNFLNESERIARLLTESGNMSDAQMAAARKLTPKGVRMTVTLIVTLPIFLAYPYVQRFFVKGIMIGAVKG
jgi:putative aldouronate transport system permease protein